MSRGLKMGLKASGFITAPKKDPKDPTYTPPDKGEVKALLEEVRKHFP